MKIFRYIHLIIFLWFSNEVKASVSVDFRVAEEIAGFVNSLFSLKKPNKFVLFPFKSKIIFRTFYNFDLEFCQNYEIRLGRRREEVNLMGGGKSEILPSFTSVSTSKIYTCKNNWTSFIPKFSFSISKRTMIKKISRRVDLYFDFYIPLLSFQVILLTKDGERFRFFHVPECADENDEDKRGKPFIFSLSNFIKIYRSAFLVYCSYSDETIKEHHEKIYSIDKIFSFLYCFASRFSFCFDIRICPYLFFCFKFEIKSVFLLFFLFRHLFYEQIYLPSSENFESADLDNRREKFIAFSVFSLVSIFNFSIRF